MADLERVVWWEKPGNADPPSSEWFMPAFTHSYVSSFNKPEGGLWTSPEGSGFGWEDWCRGEGLDSWLGTRYLLSVAGAPRILLIDSAADLERAWRSYGRQRDWNERLGPERDLNYDLIAEDYHALWLTERGHAETRLAMGLNTYAWDCETVLWFRWCFSDVRVDDTMPADG